MIIYFYALSSEVQVIHWVRWNLSKRIESGVLLTVVGLYANDSLYPLAIVVVDKETNVSWTWFIKWLQRSLELGDGSKVTLCLTCKRFV